MRAGQDRHYGMDWLRIGAFQLLILYHVGMAFVPWSFPVKLVQHPLDWVRIPMLLANPWRLSLLFAVSGYATAALFAKSSSTGDFLRSRMKRLLLPLLSGMALFVTPQPWIWVVTQHDYSQGFGYFLLHDYYRPHFIADVALPTWMHLWFVAYLAVYTVGFGLAARLPASCTTAVAKVLERGLAGPALLPLGILWIIFARTQFSPGWEDNHMLVGDWSAHATYVPMFLFGCLFRYSAPVREVVGRQWRIAAGVALSAWLAYSWLVSSGALDNPSNIARALHGVVRATEAWAAIVALLGIAERHWNRDSRWRATLAEAVFPFYLVHQTIIVVVGYWLLGTATGPLARFLIVVGATALGCWLFYLVGRQIEWLRPWIGLASRRASACKAPEVLHRFQLRSATRPTMRTRSCRARGPTA